MLLLVVAAVLYPSTPSYRDRHVWSDGSNSGLNYRETVSPPLALLVPPVNTAHPLLAPEVEQDSSTVHLAP